VTPTLRRVLLGFLAGFVLISLAPSFPALLRQVPVLLARVSAAAPPVTLDPDRIGNALLATAAGLIVVLGVLVVGRRRQASVPRRAGTGRNGPAPSASLAPSPLRGRIRQAARQGERAPALARRFHLSVDAIRTALGRETTGSAGTPGTSFRGRHSRALPAAPARTAGRLPKAYRTTA
jgi:hypothetical protein